MNIAIVNDEKILLETVEIFLRVYIKNFWSDCESRIHIENFHSAKEFLSSFSPKIYNLVILGVNMQEIAQFVRDMDYVKLMKEYDFILINDALVPISKRKKKKVKVVVIK